MLKRSQFGLKLAAVAVAALVGPTAFELPAARASDPVLTGCLVKRRTM